MVLEIGGITLGLREGVLTLIAAVAIYMVFVIVRMRRLHAKENISEPVLKAPLPKPPSVPVIVAPEVVPEPAMEPKIEAATVSDWERAAVASAGEGVYRSLEQEVIQLRDEVDAVRGELAALREDMLHELAHMRAAQTVSPIYGDAMQMAVAGYDPAMIAERCGIARAEAELVVALANSQNS